LKTRVATYWATSKTWSSIPLVQTTENVGGSSAPNVRGPRQLTPAVVDRKKQIESACMASIVEMETSARRALLTDEYRSSGRRLPQIAPGSDTPGLDDGIALDQYPSAPANHESTVALVDPLASWFDDGNSSIQELGQYPSNVDLPLPEAAAAPADRGECQAAIKRMFGGEAQMLMNAVHEAAPPPRHDDSAYAEEPALILATALYSVCEGDSQKAEKLLEAARKGPRQRPKDQLLRQQLAKMHRALAETVSGAELLCHFEGVEDPGQKGFLRHAMQIAASIALKGWEPDGPMLLSDLVAHFDKPANASWLQNAIGADDDQPQQLLAQALLHCDSRLRTPGRLEDRPYHLAYVNWRWDFTDSGAGTIRNMAFARLNKVQVYGMRADHGPRTARNLLRDAVKVFPNTIGHQKSPLSQLRYGNMGSDRGTLDIEAKRLRDTLDQARSALIIHLRQQVNPPRVVDLRRLSVVAVRIAALEQWQEHGCEHVAVDIADVLKRVEALCEQWGTAVTALDKRTMLRQLEVPSRLRKGREPGPPETGPGMTLDLEALQDWGSEAIREAQAGTPGAVPADLQRLMELVKDARRVASGKDASNRLFEWRDPFNILARRPVRQGPTLEEHKQVAQRAAAARYESTMRAGHGGQVGVNLHTVIGLKGITGAALVPAFHLQIAKQAVVSFGVSTTGFRFFVGTQPPGSVGGGLTAALGFPLPRGVAAVFGGIAGNHRRGNSAGPCITARNDIPGWEAAANEIVEFMFEHAKEPPMTDGEFSRKFAERFGDHPNIGLDWIVETSRSTEGLGRVGVTSRLNIGNGVSIGPQVATDIAYASEKGGRRTQGHGDVPVEFRTSRLTASASASLVQAVSGPVNRGGVTDLTVVLPLIGVGGEKVIRSAGGIFRIGRTADGRLSPTLCQRERQTARREDMIGLVNLRSAVWEAAMEGATAEAMSEEELRPRARLDKFRQQIIGLPPQGNVTFGELVSLDREAARQIDAYEARLKTLLGPGDAAAAQLRLNAGGRAECEYLSERINGLFDDDSNWRPVALYALEQNGKRKQGGNLGLVGGGQNDVNANRLLVLLIADKPDLTAG